MMCLIDFSAMLWIATSVGVWIVVWVTVRRIANVKDHSHK